MIKIYFYKIIDLKNNNIIYIGQTENFKSRIWKHSSDINLNNNIMYTFIRNNIGKENIKYEIIECINYENKKDINIKINENKLINKFKSDYLLNKNKNTLINNDENYNKIYYNNNYDKLNNYQINYNKLNQDKLKEKFNCFCGGKYIFSHKSTHEKTNKHFLFLTTNNSMNNNNNKIKFENGKPIIEKEIKEKPNIPALISRLDTQQLIIFNNFIEPFKNKFEKKQLDILNVLLKK